MIKYAAHVINLAQLVFSGHCVKAPQIPTEDSHFNHVNLIVELLSIIRIIFSISSNNKINFRSAISIGFDQF